MELRHLRCFLAVAEELHFARAAERLHIDQSPLSPTIKELEEELNARLFVRTTRSTQLTCAGRLFVEHVPRVFAALDQARDSVKSAANGFHGQLRIALSDGITPLRLPSLLARSREEDPEVEIRLFEVSSDQQIKGLHSDLYDAGFSMAEDAGDGIVMTPAWEDELMVAVPARHPALAFKQIPLKEVLRYPLALGDPAVFEGHVRQVDRFLRTCGQEPLIAQRVASFDVMMTLVSAGLALGLAGAAHIASSRESGVVARRLAGKPPLLTTYLLRRDSESSGMLTRFIERVAFMDSADDLSTAEDSSSD
ncbi:LysR family transcriptional regulator [Acidovorax sp. FHTAMBA]|uniref:LysR substrate-binding domain-containing protein n=1 Tax=Acidovorax sp. FHTAMBA TaxID=3140252 RepID=UPI0015F76EF4